MSSLSSLVLVLNKLWSPIRVISVKHAITLSCANKANMVDSDDFYVHSWDEWIEIDVKGNDKFILSTQGKILLPEVIILGKYDKIPVVSPRLSKKNIFVRDGYKCQYSGKVLTKSEADIDHIVPKSRGGKNSWDNLVVCDKKINRRKGNKLPEEAGLKLLKNPKKPYYKDLIFNSTTKYPESWRKFINV